MDDFRPVARGGITFLVSSDGRVVKPAMNHNGRTCKYMQFQPFIGNHGYFMIAVRNRMEGTRKKFLVHRMVVEAHLGSFEESLSVNHKDGNKLNNHIANLEMCTLAENTKHQWETGLIDTSSWSKLTKQDVADIRARKEVSRVVALDYGITARYIRRIRQGRGRFSICAPPSSSTS